MSGSGEGLFGGCRLAYGSSVITRRLLSLVLGSACLAWSASALADGDPEIGKKLFGERGCVGCHSFDGTARQGPTLQGLVGKTRPVITAEKPREIVADEEYIQRSILEPNHDIVQGFMPGAMPGLAITLDEAEHLTAAIVKLSGSVAQGNKAQGNLGSLIAAALAFVLGHLVMSSIPVRTPFEKRLGANAYQGIYSLLVIAALVWVVLAYRAAPYVELFRAAPWTRWIPNIVMPVAMIFLICSFTTRSPTMAGQEKAIDVEPQGILRITRHPMLWSFALWGLAHMTANGDIASLILFSSMTTLAIVGMNHIDARRRIKLGDAWNSFAEKTSLVPFAKGNIGQALREIGPIRIVVALVVHGLYLHLHKSVIGVSPLP